VLALGVERIDVPDERFRAVWAAVGAGEHPTIAEARGLARARTGARRRERGGAGDAGTWERAELAEALVGALDTDPFAAAYQATRSVHRAVDDHDAVLAVVRAAATPAPPS